MKQVFSPEVSRREFLRRTALGAAGLSVSAGLAPTANAASGKIPIGVQLYSVREHQT